MDVTEQIRREIERQVKQRIIEERLKRSREPQNDEDE